MPQEEMPRRNVAGDERMHKHNSQQTWTIYYVSLIVSRKVQVCTVGRLPDDKALALNPVEN
jgi:hypothetical protein